MVRTPIQLTEKQASAPQTMASARKVSMAELIRLSGVPAMGQVGARVAFAFGRRAARTSFRMAAARRRECSKLAYSESHLEPLAKPQLLFRALPPRRVADHSGRLFHPQGHIIGAA